MWRALGWRAGLVWGVGWRSISSSDALEIFTSISFNGSCVATFSLFSCEPADVFALSQTKPLRDFCSEISRIPLAPADIFFNVRSCLLDRTFRKMNFLFSVWSGGFFTIVGSVRNILLMNLFFYFAHKLHIYTRKCGFSAAHHTRGVSFLLA